MANSTDRRQIVAMGGGGFSAGSERPLLERYLLGLTQTKRPRVCFLPTASGENRDYVIAFYAAFSRLPCRPAHLSLFSPPTADLRGFLLDHDLIYVGGGNTKSMLALWKEWGLDRIFREAWEQGIVLCGSSAGSICWFEQGVTDSIPGPLTVLNCLGLLRGSNCPHYDSEPERRPSYRRMIAAGEIVEGYAADNGAALHYIGERLDRIIAWQPDAGAYRLERAGSTFIETPLDVTRLGRK